jgi:hypothetical protein
MRLTWDCGDLGLKNPYRTMIRITTSQGVSIMFSAFAAVLNFTPSRGTNSQSIDVATPLCWQPSEQAAERRKTHRLPLDQQLCLVGLDDHFRVVGEPCLVSGRDIGVEGLSFRHQQPLPYRFVGLAYRTAQGTVTTLLKLSWCRFSKPGEYSSGGKFVRTDMKLALPADWTELSLG